VAESANGTVHFPHSLSEGAEIARSYGSKGDGRARPVPSLVW
jgi:hypothetical protein